VILLERYDKPFFDGVVLQCAIITINGGQCPGVAEEKIDALVGL
jgi:hypothetical protein